MSISGGGGDARQLQNDGEGQIMFHVQRARPFSLIGILSLSLSLSRSLFLSLFLPSFFSRSFYTSKLCSSLR
jgi:hypothetical protein